MKFAIGFLITMLVGAGCRFFDLPVGSPPVIPGALLVVAMTLGYSGVDWLMTHQGRQSSTKHLCGGPTGLTASVRKTEIR